MRFPLRDYPFTTLKKESNYMACCNSNLTDAELLQALLDQERASFDRLQQVIQAIGAGTGVCSCGFGYFYNLEVSATVAIGAPFPFDTNGPFTPTQFAHTASVTPAVSAPITILNAGTYAVQYTVTVAEARQIALYLGAAVVLSTIYGQATGTAVTTGVAIIEAAAGDLLTLRNHLSAAALTLVTPSGGTASNTTNSLLITKLA